MRKRTYFLCDVMYSQQLVYKEKILWHEYPQWCHPIVVDPVYRERNIPFSIIRSQIRGSKLGSGSENPNLDPDPSIQAWIRIRVSKLGSGSEYSSLIRQSSTLTKPSCRSGSRTKIWSNSKKYCTFNLFSLQITIFCLTI